MRCSQAGKKAFSPLHLLPASLLLVVLSLPCFLLSPYHIQAIASWVVGRWTSQSLISYCRMSTGCGGGTRHTQSVLTAVHCTADNYRIFCAFVVCAHLHTPLLQRLLLQSVWWVCVGGRESKSEKELESFQIAVEDVGGKQEVHKHSEIY